MRLRGPLKRASEAFGNASRLLLGAETQWLTGAYKAYGQVRGLNDIDVRMS